MEDLLGYVIGIAIAFFFLPTIFKFFYDQGYHDARWTEYMQGEDED